MRSARRNAVFLLIIISFACHAKQEGAIEGTVLPAGTAASISAQQGGKNILTVNAAGQDGKFKLALAAGSYTVSVSAPNAPYPLQLNEVVVKPGETTILPPLELTFPAGKSVLTGKVTPPRPDGEVKLIYEGKERAAVHTDPEGKYEFKKLPAGTYEVRTSAPGHAEDVSQVVIPENKNVEQSSVLFPIVSIDGVDWAAGKIRATGIGLPPSNAANDSVRRAMAERAALADAQRNMLRTIEQIKTDTGRNVKDAMRSKNTATKIEGFLRGYTLVSERELEGGKIEVVLELPLTGRAGLSRYIAE